MSVPMLDLKAQYRTVKDAVLARMMDVIERQQFIMGAEIAELEKKVAELSHAKHAIGCASGTDAILLPLKALNLKPGDEVIAPAFTFFATAGAIHNAGGTPVFVDIEADTFNIDPDAVAAAITPRTRAIVVVDLYGQMVNMEKILGVAKKHGIAVVEDGAQAIGARRKIDGEWRDCRRAWFRRDLLVFPEQESRRLGRRWDDYYSGRRPRRTAQAAACPRRCQAVSP